MKRIIYIYFVPSWSPPRWKACQNRPRSIGWTTITDDHGIPWNIFGGTACFQFGHTFSRRLAEVLGRHIAKSVHVDSSRLTTSHSENLLVVNGCRICWSPFFYGSPIDLQVTRQSSRCLALLSAAGFRHQKSTHQSPQTSLPLTGIAEAGAQLGQTWRLWTLEPSLGNQQHMVQRHSKNR